MPDCGSMNWMDIAAGRIVQPTVCTEAANVIDCPHTTALRDAASENELFAIHGFADGSGSVNAADAGCAIPATATATATAAATGRTAGLSGLRRRNRTALPLSLGVRILTTRRS